MENVLMFFVYFLMFHDPIAQIPQEVIVETPQKYEYLGQYKITRYYSVEKNQTKYYLGTYEEDKKMNCSGDCRIPKSGIRLERDMANKVGACPKTFPSGTILLIEGKEWKCVDVGGSIKGKRLDSWCGVGQEVMDNISSCLQGYKEIWIKKQR